MIAIFRARQDSEHASTPSPQRLAPGTNIAFDSRLVAKLQSDHRELLQSYGHLAAAAEGRKFASLPGLISVLQTQLQDHLLTEKVKLYVFLAHQFTDDDLTVGIVRDFQKEMDVIARRALDFMRRYRSTPVGDADIADFQRDLAAIGTALVKRIQREEEVLYPLYRTL